MSIFEKIKSDHLAARKRQDTLVCKVLSTLIGDLQGKAIMTENGKVVPDELVIKTVKSWVKTYEDMMALGCTSDFPSYICHVTICPNYSSQLPSHLPDWEFVFDELVVRDIDISEVI